MVSEVAGERPDGDQIAEQEDVNPAEEGMLPVSPNATPTVAHSDFGKIRMSLHFVKKA